MPDVIQLNMWSKIFQPLSVAVMMLMALSFIFGPHCVLRTDGRACGHRYQLRFIFVLDQIFGPLTLV